jgi:hypothetical protein
MQACVTCSKTNARIILLLLLCALGSCKKEKDTREERISFKVNGTLKQSTGDGFVNAQYFDDLKSMQISGNIDGAEGISIAIGNFRGPGEYSGNDYLATYVAASGNTAANAYLNTNGSVMVTSYSNNYITIEFRFEGKNQSGAGVMITEGSIQAKVINE